MNPIRCPQLFDRDRSGKISHIEIGKTITDLFGWRPTKYECEKIVAIGEGYAGGEKEGQIEFREFCAMLTMAHGKGSLYEQIERMKQQLLYLHNVFLAFDVDSDYDVVFNITAVEFAKVMRCTGISYTDEQLSDIFKAVDVDGSGTLGFMEFADMLTGPTCQVQGMIKSIISDIERLYQVFDKDGDGVITFDEFVIVSKKFPNILFPAYSSK